MELLVKPPYPIDPESVESTIRDKRIGERVKQLRANKSMGLVELGKHTGLSASFLSQIETGRVVPTLRNLMRIALVFDKDLAYFFAAASESLFRIHKKSQRIRFPQSGVSVPTYFFENLGYLVQDRRLDPYLTEFLPVETNSKLKPHMHAGYEFVYVVIGRIEIVHGEKLSMIDAGDSVYFDAGTPHSYRCVGENSATAIIVTESFRGAIPSRSEMPNPDMCASVAQARPIPRKTPEIFRLAE